MCTVPLCPRSSWANFSNIGPNSGGTTVTSNLCLLSETYFISTPSLHVIGVNRLSPLFCLACCSIFWQRGILALGILQVFVRKSPGGYYSVSHCPHLPLACWVLHHPSVTDTYHQVRLFCLSILLFQTPPLPVRVGGVVSGSSRTRRLMVSANMFFMPFIYSNLSL